MAQEPILLPKDSIESPAITIDSTSVDSTTTVSLGVPLSGDALESQVIYTSKDSTIIDAVNEKTHLWGDAFVSFQSITLRAAHIELDWSKNIVTAEGLPNDTTGVIEGKPEFTEGDNNFTAGRMRYNFETRKGIVYEAITSQDDVVVRGEKSKFISAEPGDTTSHDIIYSEGATFTTCTHDPPHFVIRSKKQKVIPNNVVVVGPSNLEIMDVPTPLWLPFGFFPVASGRSTGLIFPNDYEYSDQLGFGLKQIGWFFPLGEHVNLTLTSDIYLRGSWGLGAAAQYRKRYGFNGRMTLRYDNRKVEQIINQVDEDGNPVLGPMGNPVQLLEKVPNTGIYLNWTHNQDAAAHPLNKLGGSITIQTNNFQQRVNNDARSVSSNALNSNFSFSRTWQDKPISMSVAFRHTQNNRTREMNVNFPTFQFQTQTLYPFRKKERLGAKKWYEDVTLRYTNQAQATFSGTDTTFFSQETLDNARYGVQQDVTTGTSFKVLKYFNLNPNANYKEVWYFDYEKENPTFVEGDYVIDTVALPGNEVRYDTLDYGTYDYSANSTGFHSYRTYNANLSLNTQIFGTWRFKKGPIRGLRHVIKPNISIGYQPNYLNENLDYYQNIRDTLDPTTNRLISKFRNGIYGAPPSSEMQMAMNYSITNIFEAKIFSRKDSTERNIKLFDNIYINGSYNFAADTLKWTTMSASGNTRLFKGATTVSLQARFDPHLRVENSKGNIVRTNTTTLKARGKLFEFVDASMRISTNLTVGKIRALFQGKEEEVVEEVAQTVDRQGNVVREDEAPTPFVEETDFLSLFENFSIRHNIAFSVTPLNIDQDTFKVTTNSLELRGSLGLTPNWNVDIGSIGYDFVSKRITYPYLGLRRDLHCWELGFTWAPQRNTYSFYLRVKPGTLDFLKIPSQRNNVDGSNPFNR